MLYLEQEQPGMPLTPSTSERAEEAGGSQVRLGLPSGEELLIFGSRYTEGFTVKVHEHGVLLVTEIPTGLQRRYGPAGWHWVEIIRPNRAV